LGTLLGRQFPLKPLVEMKFLGIYSHVLLLLTTRDFAVADFVEKTNLARPAPGLFMLIARRNARRIAGAVHSMLWRAAVPISGPPQNRKLDDDPTKRRVSVL
jgi:hypothetical protein